jgi:Zn ribbon nucleic-acid-binding protein
MRTCPKCESRDRKKFRFKNHVDTACANCGYVFKEDRLNLRESFFKRLKEILE